MVTSFLVRVLCILGFTLLPVFLANTWFVYGLCEGRSDDLLRDLQGTRYALLTIVGSIALAIMLAVCA